MSNPATADIFNHFHRNSLDSSPIQSTYPFESFYSGHGSVELLKKPKNFVFIYLESLERTYFNDELFPGLITQLKQIEKQGISFSNIVQVHNSGWTIAGMVASQCGIPLLTTSAGNSMGGMDSFLPGAYCLGDSLHEKNYELSYFGGAPLAFAGKGKFLKTHGFTDINGRKKLLPLLADPDYKNPWGLHDDILLDMAFDRFVALSKRKKNFGFFLLTLDTHGAKGNPSASCKNIVYGDGSNAILNSVACTDFLIGDFINRIRSSKYGKDTVVIIASDHLSMNNTAINQLKEGNRRNLFIILDPDIKEPRDVEKMGSTLDISSTILPFLGFKGNIGLGRNLLNDNESLVCFFKNFNHRLEEWRKPITKFWEFPTITNSVDVINSHKVKIDDRSFSAPLLITLTPKLNTKIFFEKHLSRRHKHLRAHVNEMDSSIPFIWFDSCHNLVLNNFLTNEIGKSCMAIGQFQNHSDKKVFEGKVLNADSSLTVSRKQIQDILFN